MGGGFGGGAAAYVLMGGWVSFDKLRMNLLAGLRS